MARKILLPSNKKGVLKKKTDTITIDKRRYFLCCKRTRIKGINAGESQEFQMMREKKKYGKKGRIKIKT